MSSNNNHINIDRNNYEEYFLMYVDNELTPEQRLAVEDFINIHPDLKEELDLLSSTILDAEPIRLFDKNALLSNQMKKEIVDEQLLLYVDNELNQQESAEIENRLASDQELKLQYEGLLKTRLDKNEIISYPNKKELYRTENERSVRSFFILRIAAAVVILLTSALFYIFSSDVTNEPPVIVQQPVKPQPQKINIVPGENSSSTTEEAIKETNTGEQHIASVQENNVTTKKPDTDNKPITPVVMPVENDQIAYTELPKVEKQTSVEANVFEKQNINNQPVTTTEAVAYTNIDALETPVPGSLALEGEEDKKGSVRGFLRKASRFIERRTGINAVNEDDELLIGVVAIKLK